MTPPGVIPGERAPELSKYSTKTQKAAPAIAIKARLGIPRILSLLIWQQHLGQMSSETANINIISILSPIKDEKGGFTGRAPYRGIIGKVEDQGVPYFVEPVHSPQSQTERRPGSSCAFRPRLYRHKRRMPAVG